MNQLKIVSFLGLTLCLTACEQTKTVLGFNRTQNDEFSVLRTPELTLPPNFKDLPSPVAKSEAADVGNESTDKARAAALGQFSSSVAHEDKGPISASEAELLKNAKGDRQDPNIRQTIAKESSADAQKNKSFVKDLFNIKESNAESTLDPFEEKKRLEETHSDQG
jgi:hypothetical protein